MGMLDVNEAANQIQNVADKDAIIIFGTSVKEELKDEMKITVIATGFENQPGNYSDVRKFDEEGDDTEGENTDKDTFEDGTPKKQTLSDVLKDLESDTVPSDFEVPSFLK